MGVDEEQQKNGQERGTKKASENNNNCATKNKKQRKTQKRDAFFLAFGLTPIAYFPLLRLFSLFFLLTKRQSPKRKEKQKRLALAGTRTRIDRVAGDHSTLRPPVLYIFLNRLNMERGKKQIIDVWKPEGHPHSSSQLNEASTLS